MDVSVQTLDCFSSDPADPVRCLSPEQDFRVRVARNDLDRAHELDLAGASAFDVAQAAGALRASLFNALAIIDDLVRARATTGSGPARSALLTPSCAVAKHNPDLREWCGFPGSVTATGWTRIPCSCECHTEGEAS